MNLLITGATGFVGRYVVAEALRKGHQVRALARSAKSTIPVHPNLSIVQGDLLTKEGLTAAVAGVDAVIHLAATKTGDWNAQHAGTVTATENLLAAMAETNVRRLILVGSMSVYDYLHLPAGAELTESSPLESNPASRDVYARMKLKQEQVVRESAQRLGLKLTVLRPGAIYGKGSLFTARLGMPIGRLWIRIGGKAAVPLTYVENCAEAIVLAAENEKSVGLTLNVIDDNPPTQRAYAALLRDHLQPKPIILPMSWTLTRSASSLLAGINKVVLRGRGKVPGLLVPSRLHARCKPLQYGNQAARNALGWTPRYSLADAVGRATTLSLDELTRVEPTSNPAAARPEVTP